MDDDDEYEAKVAAVWTPEHRAAYADHLRHLAEHAGTIPACLDEFGRCIECLRLGCWKLDA